MVTEAGCFLPLPADLLPANLSSEIHMGEESAPQGASPASGDSPAAPPTPAVPAGLPGLSAAGPGLSAPAPPPSLDSAVSLLSLQARVVALEARMADVGRGSLPLEGRLGELEVAVDYLADPTRSSNAEKMRDWLTKYRDLQTNSSDTVKPQVAVAGWVKRSVVGPAAT